jgi:hypothetical protein
MWQYQDIRESREFKGRTTGKGQVVHQEQWQTIN